MVLDPPPGAGLPFHLEASDGDLPPAVVLHLDADLGRLAARRGATSKHSVIGDRYGTSATEELSRLAVSVLQDLGYSVSRNKPYAGGFITEHYGRPARGLHALQIEINRSLYVNEQTFEKTDGFDDLAGNLTQFMRLLTEYFSSNHSDVAMAAE